jgi:hypothetical protein
MEKWTFANGASITFKPTHRHYRVRKPTAIKPLTEGETYCALCVRHVDSCECLEWFDCDKGECFGEPYPHQWVED